LSFEIVDIEPSESYEEVQEDWGWATEKGSVQLNVLEKAAGVVGRDLALTLEYDDAYQEGWIILGTRAAYCKGLLAQKPGLLFAYLEQQMRRTVRTELKHRNKHRSYEDQLDRMNLDVV
jgi:hypothetical protein